MLGHEDTRSNTNAIMKTKAYACAHPRWRTPSSEQTSLCYRVQFFPRRRKGFESDSNLVHFTNTRDIFQTTRSFSPSFKKIPRAKYKLFSGQAQPLCFSIIYSFPNHLLDFLFCTIKKKKERILARFSLAKDMIILLVTLSLHKDSSVDRVEIGS